MTKKQAILNAAQAKVRLGGYNNFSFRELADEVGIKSASVHYYFPTKGDLGAELAHQYTNNFLASLGTPDALIEAGKDPLECYIKLFRDALLIDEKMCLCGVLGAESASLPELLRKEVKRFFQHNIVWLEQAFIRIKPGDKANANTQAIKTLALLEGAMLMSNALDDHEIFEQAMSFIRSE